MTKCEAIDMAIIATIGSGMEGEDMIEVLDFLFEERRTAKFLERREAANAAAS